MYFDRQRLGPMRCPALRPRQTRFAFDVQPADGAQRSLSDSMNFRDTQELS